MKKRERVILVCGRILLGEALHFDDNVIARCDVCRHPVQHRPHAPKRSIPRCIECYAELADPDDEHFTTPRMVLDWLRYSNRRKH